jgi:hypothetical protein
MGYLADTYGFVYGDILQGVGRAHNMYGYGDYSAINVAGATVLTKPT